MGNCHLVNSAKWQEKSSRLVFQLVLESGHRVCHLSQQLMSVVDLPLVLV